LLAANEDLRRLLRRAGPFNVVYERSSLWSHAAMEYARDVNVPGLLEVNAPLIEEQARHRGLADEGAARQTADRVFGAAAALVAVSDEVAAYLEGHASARGRVHVVPNGAARDRFPAGLAPALPRERGSFVVGFLGSLKPWHGLGVLLDAFVLLHARDASYRLLIVGDGPLRERLSADVAARGNGLAWAVRLTGAVSPSRVPGLLASMDVATAPYPDPAEFYFSPLKIYEYMAAARPIVASRLGQLSRLIRDEVNGLLCRPGDAPALAEAIERLRRDPALRERLGQTARGDALANHSWNTVVRRLFRIAAGCRQADRLPGEGNRRPASCASIETETGSSPRFRTASELCAAGRNP
jgi:glycosyltransferase involved in cell wall biosynthesis